MIRSSPAQLGKNAFMSFNRFGAGFGLALLLLAGPSAAAEKNFDGTWSVRMVTEAGSCDAAYNYAISVQGSSVRYVAPPGEAQASVSGGIASDGTVRLGIHRSIARADAAGRLTGKSGSGTWSLALLGCSGRWTAQKRIQTAAGE
jgi:hypothetical protein